MWVYEKTVAMLNKCYLLNILEVCFCSSLLLLLLLWCQFIDVGAFSARVWTDSTGIWFNKKKYEIALKSFNFLNETEKKERKKTTYKSKVDVNRDKKISIGKLKNKSFDLDKVALTMILS